MPSRDLLVAVALVACGNEQTPEKRTAPAPDREQRTLASWEMQLPPGWTAEYDAAADAWQLAAGASTARFERAPANAVAGPDAFLHHRRGRWPEGTAATIESRQATKDGFVLTARVAGRRATYVVREIGSTWYQCVSEQIADDDLHEQLLAVCRSVKP